MSDLIKVTSLLREEIERVKLWSNYNNFDNMSAVSLIVRRYRSELKQLLNVLMQDLHEQKETPPASKIYLDDGTVFNYEGFTYTLYKVPGDGWQWKNSSGKYALGQNFYYDGLLDAEQIARMAKHLP